MTGFVSINLADLIAEKGEDFTKGILASFSCPLNLDVEQFLRAKAIPFSAQGISRTHLIFASYKDEPVLVGYYALANKYIHVYDKDVSKNTRKRIGKFGQHNSDLHCTILSAPLIAQLGKNFTCGYNTLISGKELLEMACQKVAAIQYDVGGKVVYLECEDKSALVSFYENNGFVSFGKRSLDRDETSTLQGEYLIQMLRIQR